MASGTRGRIGHGASGAASRAGRAPARWLAAFAVAGLAACQPAADDGWQGYAEGEFVMMAAPASGQLLKRYVQRGAQVTAGAPLFLLERDNETQARREAEARALGASAREVNLGQARRAPEIDALQAQLAQAEATALLSARQLEQQQALYARGFVAEAGLDLARANAARDRARVAELRAQLRNATLAIGRVPELAAARADAQAARAQLAQSEWRLAQRAVAAPAAALVQDTFYSEGEWVPAGAPVLSLLPPGNIKARFFVPETALGRLQIGQRVLLRCDGCTAPIAATISYLSQQAEYTPPVIYSREQRAKLVFLVEARPAPADAVKLKPGQPLDVRLDVRPDVRPEVQPEVHPTNDAGKRPAS